LLVRAPLGAFLARPHRGPVAGAVVHLLVRTHLADVTKERAEVYTLKDARGSVNKQLIGPATWITPQFPRR
jgi:hypothetical protein